MPHQTLREESAPPSGDYVAAFDSEFLMSGRKGCPEDVWTIQFAIMRRYKNGWKFDERKVFWEPEELKTWLIDRWRIKILYGFVVLPDIASIGEWTGLTRKGEYKFVKIGRYGVQTRGSINFHKFKCKVFDSHELAKSFGLRKLEDVGNVVGLPKLAKPKWLGLRRWKSAAEKEYFRKYALRDAEITAKLIVYMREKLKVDPVCHVSAGTVARDEFKLPRRIARPVWKHISPLELRLRNEAGFAGRSEVLIAGFHRNAFYNDIKSQYPNALFATRALSIRRVVECAPEEICLCRDLNCKNYGWLEGVFETDNDVWGLPLRLKNVTYVTGRVQGLFHSFDLAAAKARSLLITRAWKPVFDAPKGKYSRIHAKLRDMLIRRIEGKLDKVEDRKAKGVMNSLGGKTLQVDPTIPPTANFPCGLTMWAHSHLQMSLLCDEVSNLGGLHIGMDTDSVFSNFDLSGKLAELSDGEVSVPLFVDLKGKGNLAFFRSKRYVMIDESLFSEKDILNLKEFPEKGLYIARQGWEYPWEDFVPLFYGFKGAVKTRRDIKHTLMTREIKAQKFTLGRWKEEPVVLPYGSVNEEKTLAWLLRADFKRKRESYDSLRLVTERRVLPSSAWNVKEVWSLPENLLGYGFG